MSCVFAVWLWLFHPGSITGFGGRKEALVDRAGDMQSIFAKLHTLVRRMPHYLVPKGFDEKAHSNFTRIINPANGAAAGLMQTACYLAAFAATAIVLALTLNWRNDRLGFWVNGVVVGIADIPFILFVLIPEWPGLLGPVLWIAAFSVTGLARMGATSVAHQT